MFGALGLPEILIILVIGVLIFGGVKIPGILRSLSSGVRGYRKVKDTVRNPMNLDRWIADEEPEQDSRSRPRQYGYYQGPQGPSPQGPSPQGPGPQEYRDGGYTAWPGRQQPEGGQYYGPQYPDPDRQDFPPQRPMNPPPEQTPPDRGT